MTGIPQNINTREYYKQRYKKFGYASPLDMYYDYCFLFNSEIKKQYLMVYIAQNGKETLAYEIFDKGFELIRKFYNKGLRINNIFKQYLTFRYDKNKKLINLNTKEGKIELLKKLSADPDKEDVDTLMKSIKDGYILKFLDLLKGVPYKLSEYKPLINKFPYNEVVKCENNYTKISYLITINILRFAKDFNFVDDDKSTIINKIMVAINNAKTKEEKAFFIAFLKNLFDVTEGLDKKFYSILNEEAQHIKDELQSNNIDPDAKEKFYNTIKKYSQKGALKYLNYKNPKNTKLAIIMFLGIKLLTNPRYFKNKKPAIKFEKENKLDTEEKMYKYDLLELCKKGSEKEIKEAIENGSDINAKDKNGMTPLMYYVMYYENEELVKLLLNKGANINSKLENGVTSLMIASQYNKNEKIIEILIEKGADVNARSYNKFTPLMYAAGFNENEKVTKLLIDKGAKINLESNFGSSALILATKNNKNEKVIKILLEHGAYINKIDNNYMTPLMYAARDNENEKVLEVLLNHKYYKNNINRIDESGFGDINPLFFAAKYNKNEKVLETLIEKGADVNLKNRYGYNVLMDIVGYAGDFFLKKIEILIKNGIKLNEKDYNMGDTALIISLRNGGVGYKTIEMLIKNGANVNLKNKEGKTPLMYAVKKRR